MKPFTQRSETPPARRPRGRAGLLQGVGLLFVLGSLLPQPARAHVGHAGRTTGAGQQGTQATSAGQVGIGVQPNGRNSPTTPRVYLPRQGSMAVAVGLMGPHGNVHAEISWAPLSSLEVGARLGLGAAEFDAGNGRTLKASDYGALVFARWLPWPLHTPYVDIGAGLVSEFVRGADSSTLGFNRSLAFSRKSNRASAYAAAGYSFRPGSGLVFAVGVGIETLFGRPSVSTFVATGQVDAAAAAAVVADMDAALIDGERVAAFAELSVGVAF